MLGINNVLFCKKTVRARSLVYPPGNSYFQNQPGDYTQLSDNSWPTITNDGWLAYGTSHLDIVTEGTEPYSAYSLRFTYDADDYGDQETGTTAYAGNVVRWFPQDVSEVYISVLVKKSSNWQDHPTGGDSPKLCFILDDETGGGGDPLYFRCASNDKPAATIQNADLPPQRSLGQNVGTDYMADDEWVEIEAQAIMNSEWLTDINEDGTADGIFRLWVNGTKVCEYTDCWFSDASTPLWEKVNMNPLWGGKGGYIPADMYLYMNHTRLAYKI